MYQVELVWNREFSFVPRGEPRESVEEAKKYAVSLLDMGDGARVKKCQVVDYESGDVIVPSHKIRT